MSTMSPLPAAGFQRLARVCAGFAALLAVGVLVGWSLDIVRLKHVFPNLTVMNPIVAVAIGLAAVSLALQTLRERPWPGIGRAAGWGVLAIAASRLADVYLGTQLEWDRLLFREQVLQLVPPDHMAVTTAWALTLSGLALASSTARFRGAAVAGQTFALLSGAIALAGLIAYANFALALIAPQRYPMALHAALGLLALSLGALCLRPREGVMQLFSSQGPGGQTLRHLVPAFILLPLGLSLPLLLSRGGSALAGAQAIVQIEFEFTLIALLLVVWHGLSLDRADERMRQLAASADARRREAVLLAAQLDASPEGILVIDENRRLVTVNRRYVEMFDVPASVDLSPGASVTPLVEYVLTLVDDPAELLAGLEQSFIDLDVPIHDETRTKDGRVFERVSGAMHSPEGVYLGRLWAIREVTERKNLELELRKRYEQLRELDQLKSTFVSAVSHDLRTPLTTIKGFAEFLADDVAGPLTPAQRDFVEQIERGTSRLEHLVDDLLDFARLEAGTFTLRPYEADLAEKVREIVDSLRLLAKETGATMLVDLPAEPLLGRFDAPRLGQVLTNLLHNALKATPAGGRVVARARREGDSLVCEISDTGPGIAEADRPKLFQRFSQIGASPEKGGTGLGLSISKAIVEAHGGHIEHLAGPGPGATFRFDLPIAGPAGASA